MNKQTSNKLSLCLLVTTAAIGLPTCFKSMSELEQLPKPIAYERLVSIENIIKRSNNTSRLEQEAEELRKLPGIKNYIQERTRLKRNYDQSIYSTIFGVLLSSVLPALINIIQYYRKEKITSSQECIH